MSLEVTKEIKGERYKKRHEEKDGKIFKLYGIREMEEVEDEMGESEGKMKGNGLNLLFKMHTLIAFCFFPCGQQTWGTGRIMGKAK